MDTSLEKASPSPAATPLLVFAGVVFMVLWLFAHGVWMSMALMGTLMANDSGTASPGQWSGLILGVLSGQVLAALAGIPGGAAFFWRGRRRFLLVLFGTLFVLGAVVQAVSFYAYFQHR